MRAELARTGWIIAAAGLALGATFAVRQHASQPQATPAVVPREVAAVAVDTDTSVRLPGDVWYVSHDLDGDGRPELIARDQHTVYVFHADDTLHPIARLPYGQRDGVCASELRVEGDQLIVEDYAVTRYGDDACQLRTIRHYRFAPGRIDLGRVTIDN